MKILITGKKIELTDGIKGAVEDKLGKLEKYLHEDTEVKVTVSARKAKQKIEVTIIPINGPIIRAEYSEENLYAAIDVVYDKLNKKFDMKPMSPEEAVLQMELVGHDFYMFRNIDTDEISIVYRRETGGYGLIEHE